MYNDERNCAVSQRKMGYIDEYLTTKKKKKSTLDREKYNLSEWLYV